MFEMNCMDMKDIEMNEHDNMNQWTQILNESRPKDQNGQWSGPIQLFMDQTPVKMTWNILSDELDKYLIMDQWTWS